MGSTRYNGKYKVQCEVQSTMRSTKYNLRDTVMFLVLIYVVLCPLFFVLCSLSFVLIYVVLCKLYFVLIYVVLCTFKSFKSLMHPKCEKKLTEIFDVTMSQCHNVTKLKLPPCNTARWELTKHRAEKPIVRMNEGHKKVRSEK